MRSRLIIAAAVFATAFMFPASAWAAVTFAPAVTYASGNFPFSLAIADLNADGKPDLVTANLSSNDVSVLLGNGDGTFAAQTAYPTGDDPISVAIADLNADGKPDLGVATRGPDSVSVLLGNGDGTFGAPTPYPTGDDPRSVGIADLNADGKLDLATANALSDNVSVLLGNGDGTFTAHTTYPTDAGSFSVSIADLNADSKPDLVTANSLADNISVLLGNGDGTFTAHTTYPTNDFPVSVGIADLDADGRPDLAVANLDADNVSVLLGNGDGTFAAPTSHPTGTGPLSVAIGDLDGDSKPDLATADVKSNSIQGSNVSVMLGNGDGTFAAPIAYLTGGIAPASVAIADLNADSKPDLAASNENSSSTSVLLNTSTPPADFTTGPTASISGTVRQGQTLTADEGSPDPVPDSFSYTWFADGAEIAGETAKTLLLTSAQVGKKISVEVTAHKAGYNDASDTSPETVAVVGVFTPGPTAKIDGLARVGSTLYARPGSPSPAPTSFAYRWLADGKLVGTARTLKLTLAHHGKRIQVRIYAIKSGYLTASSLSPATARVSNLQPKTISMELNDYTVKRGQRVYAEIELLASGEPWSIVLDGKKLASGVANTKGIAVTGLTIPANATTGERILRAYGKFPDRTDPDRITVR